MHIHTVYSDGEYEPSEVIKKAIDKGIKTLAITDHDTLDGIKSVNKDDYNINIINGIELSAKVNKGRMHILGYDLDINNKQLNDKMIELRNNSYYSIIALLTQLKLDYGIIFNYNDIQDIFNSLGNVGRPHLALLLIKYGYVKTVDEAFRKYLNSAYKKTRTSNKGVNYEECICLIKEANGISILAHPNQLHMDDMELEKTLKKLIDCGLDGIEVYHSGHSKVEIEKYLLFAHKYHLLISGGSDYHGENVKPDIELGCNKIKELSLVNYINKRNTL